jgi:hypothetical protein
MALTACGTKEKAPAKKGVHYDAASEAIEVDASSSEADGIVKATFAVDSPNTQLVHGAAGSRLDGAVAAFPPGAFDVDFEVKLYEGHTLATRKNLTDLGYSDDTIIVGSGPAAVVTWTYDEDSLRAYRLTLPAPSGLPAGSQTVAFYVRNVPGEDGHLLGVIPADQLTAKGAGLELVTQSYGVFQLVALSTTSGEAPTKPGTASEVPTTTTVDTSPVLAGSAPGAFTITGPKDEVSGPHPRVTWTTASGVETYALKLDLDDPACGNPYRIYDGLQVTAQLVDAQTGTSFVCVVASNAGGSTLANNAGFKLAADGSPPPTPSRPSGGPAISPSIEITYTWSAVTDVGAAGLSHYELEVGTTSGGADVFSGDIVDKTSKAIVGFDGSTYYARVRAVDLLGNASAWSPVSAGVTIDAD